MSAGNVIYVRKYAEKLWRVWLAWADHGSLESPNACFVAATRTGAIMEAHDMAVRFRPPYGVQELPESLPKTPAQQDAEWLRELTVRWHHEPNDVDRLIAIAERLSPREVG